MENSQHIKTVSTDPRSKNRIRYKSSRQRAKTASADVYRSYKRQFGVTSAASREERVHHPSQEESGRERKRQRRQASGSDDRVAILRNDLHVDGDSMDESDVDFESTFASELDLALDRNASEIFGRFHREVWHLARSLPEVLHHAEEIVGILISYLLSPESDPSAKSPIVTKIPGIHEDRETFVANHATTDILHLLAVLARDLRHEIHPFIHTLIVPRIVYDLLNPPLPPPDSGRQPLPLNVTVVEAAFRTLSYVFRYDAEPLLSEVDKEGQEPCLECLRQYYGATLGHRRDYVRRLAAETFAPMVRKLGSDASRRRHLRRVLRALATSAATISVNERPLSECLTRSQRDAVDGIALLFFETARGANGRLHSKGQLTVRCLFDCVTASDDSAKSFEENRIEMMRLVVSAAVDKLCGYLTRDGFCSLWEELQRISRRLVSTLPTLAESEDDENLNRRHTLCPLVSALRLWEQCVSFKDGQYLTEESSNGQKVIKSIVDLLVRLLSPTIYNRLQQAIQILVLRVLGSSWRALPDNVLFTSKIGDVLPELLRSNTGQKTLFDTAEFLARELLPHLPPHTGIKYVGTAILSAAAQKASMNRSEALMLMLAVASTRVGDSEASNDTDDLFFVEGARHCDISDQERSQLIDLCMFKVAPGGLSSAILAEVAVATRCLPFLACSGGADESKRYQKRVGKWTRESLQLLCSSMKAAPDGFDETEQELVVVCAFLLESFSVLARQKGSSHDKDLTLLRPLAEQMLLAHPKSLWTVKSVASYVGAAKDRGEQFSESIDAVFDALIPNLGMQNHFLRLHTLEILCSFPQRPFITDHADIDWTGDLDEEPLSTPGKSTGHDDGHSNTPTGLCDILETLLDLESSPISLDNERHLVSCITRVEMLTRTGRLPIVYAEAASNHMLGIMNTKFAPIWAPAVRTITILASTNEACAWPPILRALGETMELRKGHNVGGEVSTRNSRLANCTEHFSKCILWDESGGSNPVLFSDDIVKANDEGRVSRHLSTDRLTICELVWSVLEKSPELAAKKSRGIVPIFFEFLLSQYYCFNDHDADARELNLEAEVEKSTSWSKTMLHRNEIQQRLLCFLKMFAAINGPRQLYKHQLLLSIFTAFLSHQETRVAQTALSCILKYKLAFLLPYADHLQAMLKKGELREALLRFDISKSAGVVLADHRSSFIPMMQRVLFGRLSSRVSTGKSSKDTPATRRASILSFLSALSEDESELYPLFYLMVRSYIPAEYNLKPIEDQTEEDRMRIDEVLNSLELKDVAELPIQRHEGFLNLLSAVVTQLGKGVTQFLPCFLSILVTLCKYSEIKAVEDASDSDMDGSSEISPANRLGSVRTLCFRRLADCFDQYADSLDFMPYCERLWASVAISIDCLPSAAATADRAPALLVMLETLSRHASLIPLLQRNEAAVEGVIMCVAPSTQQPVMESTLSFLDNLLTNGGTITDEVAVGDSSMDGPGLVLIRKHVPLILRHFAERLGASSNTGWKRSPSKSKEFSILCRLSRLLLENGSDIGKMDVLETLCGLLIGYLETSSRGNELDQLQVIEILSMLIPRIDGDAALSFLPTVSKLLGPVKSSAGIESLRVRKSLASLIQSISRCTGVPMELREIAAVSAQLCASHSKRVDELDYDLVLLALTGLSDSESTTSWTGLCGRLDDTINSGDPALLNPLVNICSHLLHNDDGVVSRGAFKALKTLLVLAGRQPAAAHEECTGFIEKAVVPIIRNGLSSRSQAARRLYILLLAEVARNFKDLPSPNLYGDLACLIRDDEPELDFFLNITHVQIHRRCRALQRLRDLLGREGADKFHPQSLSNILLPIALHPIYESKTKLEEPFALEAISTVGAISKSLSWSKYHGTLWTSLIQLQRNSEQERYLIDMICSMLDSFHFQLEKSPPGDDENVEKDRSELSGNAVWRALENRIIPKVENLLFKEKVGKDREKIKVLRPQVVLALLKLFQKFPVEVFESKLPRLLAIMCGALKSKDSDSRDVARVTLAKMTTSMSKKYLHQVIHHLSTSLTEGYQLHVRMATLHTILLHTAEQAAVILPASSESAEDRAFDRSIPTMMNLIQDDLFGTARERREAEGAKKRFVKEASGSKSNDAIELICRLLEFKPSLAAEQESGPSAIHCVVMPLLGRLESQDTTAATIGRIRECLSRVIVGLSKNQSVTASQMFPFIYASVSPFIAAQNITHQDDDSCSDDEEPDGRIVVSSDKRTNSPQKTEGRSESKPGKVVQWRPSALKISTSNRDARNTKDREHRELHRVRDGYNAPKLTGSGRLRPTANTLSETLNNPASICAVLFGLGLLHSTLKKTKLSNEPRTSEMVDPFIPLLTTCLCASKDDDVILLSIRCLVLLLRMPLPSVERCSTDVGAKVMDILTLSGSLTNLNQELTQSCFKVLTLLISKVDVQKRTDVKTFDADHENALSSGQTLPLDPTQMQALISLLKGAVVDTDHHNPSFGLIKAITSRRYISAEFYDLMETCLELSVRSQKVAVRQLSGNIFMQYLLEYPMGKQRLEDHLKQIVSNTKYEYEEGRLSGLGLATTVIEKLPSPLLDEHAQLFFLPLVLQLVNDESKECREAVAKCLERLLARASVDTVQSFYDYAVRWSKGDCALQRTSIQLFGIFVDSRPDFMARADTANVLLDRLCDFLEETGQEDEWEIPYFALVCLEKMGSRLPEFGWNDRCAGLIVKSLVHDHPWVKRAACRLVVSEISAIKPESILESATSRLVLCQGLLYKMATNICALLDLSEHEQDEELSLGAIKILSWIFQASRTAPSLFTDSDNTEEGQDPAAWLIERISHLAKQKGSKRRSGIFKAFAAFASFSSADRILPLLEFMIEPLHRSITEAENLSSVSKASFHSQSMTEETEEATLARDTLQMLEDCCSEHTDEFLRAYANVKTKARDKKEQRKQHAATEAIRDPRAAAVRKMKKQEREKKRRKRRVEDQRLQRGGQAKRRHLS